MRGWAFQRQYFDQMKTPHLLLGVHCKCSGNPPQTLHPWPQHPQGKSKLLALSGNHLTCRIAYYHPNSHLLPSWGHCTINIHFVTTQLWRAPFYLIWRRFSSELWSFIRYLELIQHPWRTPHNSFSISTNVTMSYLISIFPYPPTYYSSTFHQT